MHFQHVPFGFLARETENLLKDHRHVGHQIDRIVMNYDLPGNIDRFIAGGIVLDGGIFHR